MTQATTPTFILTIPDSVDLTVIKNIYFTLKQGIYTIQKSGQDLQIEGNTISVYLNQDDTVKLKTGDAKLQLNWTYEDGSRACSNIVQVPINENLIKEVLE